MPYSRSVPCNGQLRESMGYDDLFDCRLTPSAFGPYRLGREALSMPVEGAAHGEVRKPC